MKIQQHDGVVVDAAGSGSASPSVCGRRGCSKGGGRPQVSGCGCPPTPPPSLYRDPRGAPALGDGIS